MTITLHYFSIKSLGVGVVARLNGVALFAEASGKGGMTTRPVNAWLMPAKNLLKLELNAVPKSMIDEAPTGKVTLEVFEADPEQEFPTPLRMIHTFAWEEGSGASLPLTLEEPLAIASPPPTLLWREAVTLAELTPLDKAQLIQLTGLLADHLMAGRVDQAYDLVSYRYADEARAEGKSEATFRDVVLTQYRWLAGLKDLAVTTPTLEDTVFRRLYDDKLVALEGRGPATLLFSSSEEIAAGLPIYAAKIEGQWRIAR